MLLWLLRLKIGRRPQPGVLGLTIVVVIIGAPAVIVVSELNDGVSNSPAVVGSVDNFPSAVSGADGLVGSSVPRHPPEDAAPAPRGSCGVSSPAKSTSEPGPNVLGALPV